VKTLKTIKGHTATFTLGYLAKDKYAESFFNGNKCMLLTLMNYWDFGKGKLKKMRLTISFDMFQCLSACSNLNTAERILMKIGNGEFF
jgi:hypothetical protein